MLGKFNRKESRANATVCMLCFFIALLSICSLGACGKRPGQLATPAGSDSGSFPRTYPDPSTDPSP